MIRSESLQRIQKKMAEATPGTVRYEALEAANRKGYFAKEEDAMPELQQGVKESKEQRFVRLATKRTQSALNKIRLIGNLGRSGYGYSDDQVGKILAALRHAIGEVEERFQNKKRGSEETFKL